MGRWGGGGADLRVPGSPLAALTGGPLCAPAEPFVLALQLQSQAVKRGNDIMKSAVREEKRKRECESCLYAAD